MLKLLKIEWLKIKNYNAFIILSSFFALGVIGANYVVYLVFKNMVNETAAGKMVGQFSPYNFDKVWQTTSYTSGCLLLLPALLIIILMTNEFSYRTHRQNIIDGWTRLEFIQVKIALALIGALAATILVIVTALGFGFTSGTSFSTYGMSHLGYFFLKAFSYNMVAILIGVLIRRTGFAIGVFFIYMGLENFISQLLDVWSIKLKTESHLDMGSMGDYLPMNASDGLLTFPENPFKSLAKNVLPSEYYWLTFTLAILYVILFYVWSVNRITKTDL